MNAALFGSTSLYTLTGVTALATALNTSACQLNQPQVPNYYEVDVNKAPLCDGPTPEITISVSDRGPSDSKFCLPKGWKILDPNYKVKFSLLTRDGKGRRYIGEERCNNLTIEYRGKGPYPAIYLSKRPGICWMTDLATASPWPKKLPYIFEASTQLFLQLPDGTKRWESLRRKVTVQKPVEAVINH